MKTEPRSAAKIIEAYSLGESMTDEEVIIACDALKRLYTAVVEVGNDVNLVIPWLVPKLHSFEGFAKHRAERREKESKRIADINAKLRGDKSADDVGPGEWGVWIKRSDASFPFQEWHPFLADDYVQVSSTSIPERENPKLWREGKAKDFWWGYVSGLESDSVIRSARRWIRDVD